MRGMKNAQGKNSLENNPLRDWHREEIKCAVRLRGYSMAELSRLNGLASGTLSNALVRHWPKGEKIIANTLGMNPEEIWPSRYQPGSGEKKRVTPTKK